MRTDVFIRSATIDDASRLAALAERSFRDAFAADNSPSQMQSYTSEAFSLDRMRSELADTTNTFFVASANGFITPSGYAKLRAGLTDPSVKGPDPVELERLYVDRVAIGQGIGSALMSKALDAARTAGHKTVWLGVWERNARAIAFYKKWGFETVGTHVFRLGTEDQTDLVMMRRI